jgi:hypothetical protein
MDMGFMYGHGTSDIEEDANQYAISKACNNEELDMFKYQRLLQRYSALSTKEERIALDKYYNKFAKKYTLPKVAKTGIAIAACTAIGYMLLNKRRK